MVNLLSGSASRYRSSEGVAAPGLPCEEAWRGALSSEAGVSGVRGVAPWLAGAAATGEEVGRVRPPPPRSGLPGGRDGPGGILTGRLGDHFDFYKTKT